MTFCLGVRVSAGLVALADSQIVRGHQVSSKAKLSTLQLGDRQVLVMTSGLRSVRDKVVARLEDALRHGELRPDRVHEVATAFGAALRQVRDEDELALRNGGLTFNLHAVVGGCLPGDDGPELYEVFPEGNWVAATVEAPYLLIGRSSYAKAFLDRTIGYGTPLGRALNAALVAFDATRTSAVDVDYPIDVAVLAADGSALRQARYDAADVLAVEQRWHAGLLQALADLPDEWAADVLRPILTEPSAWELPS